MKTLTKEDQDAITPQIAIQLLKNGNQRFIQNKKSARDLSVQIDATKSGQYPFATILNCIDSRVPSEIVFDQGIGDIFSVRIAGNFVNEDILGSLEFACKLARAKLILVLGHTSCGAIKGACDNAELGNLTAMLTKIKPAVRAVSEPSDPTKRNSKNISFVNEVAIKNVHLTIDRIRRESSVLKDMEDNEEIMIIGGMYDISSGEVTLL